MENYIYLLFFTELIFMAFSYVLTRGNLLSPSLVSYAMFAVATVCIIYNVEFWEVQYSSTAYWLTTIGFFVMLLPEIAILKLLRYRPYSAGKTSLNSKSDAIKINKLVNIFIAIIAIVLTIIYVYAVMKRGANLGGSGLNAIGIAKHDEAGASGLERLLYRALMILFYVFAYIVVRNKALAKEKLSAQIKYMIPMVCFLVASFFNGNRLGLLKCFLAIYVAVLAFTYQSRNFTKKDIWKIMRYVVMVGVVIVIVFYLLRVITKVNTTTADRTFLDYITYYIGSPVYLFSKYLDNPLQVHAPNTLFGETTFTALLQELGFSPEYQNNVLYVGGESYFAGNAMSWFQEPLNDYGIIGMYIFTFIVYWVFAHMLYKGILKKRSEIAMICMMYFYFVVVMSFYYCQTMWAVSITNIIFVILIIMMVRWLPRLKI
ncbi:MAG: oligosaccharide repeat unit polymerase [Agathobacter sp.]|nr:oligosaccharide repeat unit polymerase [Agathobacter sp.]